MADRPHVAQRGRMRADGVNVVGKHDSASRVVVGIDGSPSSHAALRWAVQHAELIGGDVVAVAAWDVPWAYGLSGPAVDPTFDQTVAEQALVNQVHEVLGESGAAPGAKASGEGPSRRGAAQ
ncbi:universal stress protein [Streptomyces xantholiticus]